MTEKVLVLRAQSSFFLLKQAGLIVGSYSHSFQKAEEALSDKDDKTDRGAMRQAAYNFDIRTPIYERKSVKLFGQDSDMEGLVDSVAVICCYRRQ